jgi:hypothetical protein
MRFTIMPILAILLCTISVSAKDEQLSPSDTYMQYHNALQTATAVDAVEPFMCKKVIKEIDETPAEMKPKMFGLIKELTPTTVKVESEKIEGDQATLKVIDASAQSTPKGINEKTDGSVTLVREDGTWKIDKESWNSHITSGAQDEPTQ